MSSSRTFAYSHFVVVTFKHQLWVSQAFLHQSCDISQIWDTHTQNNNKRKYIEMRMKEKQPAVSTKYTKYERITIITKDCLVYNKRPSRHRLCRTLPHINTRSVYFFYHLLIIISKVACSSHCSCCQNSRKRKRKKKIM